MNNWAKVPESVKTDIVNYLNNIYVDKITLSHQQAQDNSFLMTYHDLVEKENSIIDFLEHIGLPVAFSGPGHWNEYFALDEDNEDWLEEWAHSQD